MRLPTIEDVLDAANRIAGRAVETPLLENDAVNRRLGFRLLVKAESLQKTGSFKFRGALNVMAALDADQRRAGVVAYSSGNHAQGIAAAAALFDVPALIVMPRDAPAIKLAGTRAYGAEIVTYDRWREQRELVAGRIAAERGAKLVPPYDDPDVIAGQGTVALEIIAQTARAGVALDSYVACASGGGLMAGSALAFAAGSGVTRLYTAEPEAFDDHARSLASGSRQSNSGTQPSICDALMAPIPGEITFAVNRDLVSAGLRVSDAEVADAMLVAFRDFKLVVEPGGAAALAAVLSGKLPDGQTAVAVVASGGNVDPPQFSRLLSEAQERSH